MDPARWIAGSVNASLRITLTSAILLGMPSGPVASLAMPSTPIKVLGQQEVRVARMSAVAISGDAVGMRGARISGELRLDRSFGFIQARRRGSTNPA